MPARLHGQRCLDWNPGRHGYAGRYASGSGHATYTLSCTGGTFTRTGQASATLTVNAPSAYSATSLVSDTAGTGALVVDPNLVNPWGVVFGPTTPAWVANNHTDTSTLYDGNGKAQPAATPLIVHLPDGFDPTGIVFNGGTSFAVAAAGKTGPARFIFDGEGGMVGGWSPAVDTGHVVKMYTDAGGAIYKGLAIANNGTGDFLYATDFHNNKIDVFDASFNKQTPTSTSFRLRRSDTAGRLRAVRHSSNPERPERRNADLRQLCEAGGTG